MDRLLELAAAPATVGDPDLHLRVDGRRVDPVAQGGNRYIFRFPGRAQTVRLRSRSSTPRAIDPASEDLRRLGVAIQRIQLETEGVSIDLAFDSFLLSDGYNFAEPELRWTTGDAAVPHEALCLLGAGEANVTIDLAGALPAYPDDDPLDEHAAPAPKAEARFHFSAEAPQQIGGGDLEAHYEGVDISLAGDLIAVAASGANEVRLFRRAADRTPGDGAFEDRPFKTIGGAGTGFVFPHDVAFTPSAVGELLAVLERRGVLSVWRVEDAAGTKGEPLLRQDISALAGGWLDTIAFLPGGEGRFAVADGESGRITFLRLDLDAPQGPKARVESVFSNSHFTLPDGLAFSGCGSWMAVANHGADTVAIFERTFSASGAPCFAARPAALIRDPALTHPHSVAFTPDAAHLIVTCAGGPDLYVFEARTGPQGPQWDLWVSSSAEFAPPSVFNPVNEIFRCEGGAKGISVRGGLIAAASPEMGVKLYRYEE